MKLYLVRHAKSLRNIGIKTGENSELTADGKEQAKRLGLWFKKIKIHHIYCSKLKRAKDTLKEMKTQLKHISPINYTEKMDEHNIGIYGKKGFDDWQGYFKDAAKSGQPFYKFKPKNGESFEELQKRSGKFYHFLLNKHKNQSVILVGHGFFLKHLLLEALGLPAPEARFFGLENASVSQLYIKRKKVTHFHVSDFHHLLIASLEKKKAPKLLLKK